MTFEVWLKDVNEAKIHKDNLVLRLSIRGGLSPARRIKLEESVRASIFNCPAFAVAGMVEPWKHHWHSPPDEEDLVFATYTPFRHQTVCSMFDPWLEELGRKLKYQGEDWELVWQFYEPFDIHSWR